MSRFCRLVRMMVPAMLLLLSSAPAAACSVCFGDSDSPMAKGAFMGVVVLCGIVGFVLLGVAGTGLFWMHRGHRLAQVQAHESSKCPG